MTYWEQFRDAFNATGTPVYLYFCPRSFVNSISPPVYDGPPRVWTGGLRKSLANTLLTEYHNAQDSWDSAMSNLDALLKLGNVSWSGPGFWQDADMLQTCNYGGGATPGDGMSLAEYSATFAVWSVLASQIIVSPDITTLREAHPDCLALLLNKRLLAVNQDDAGAAPRVLFNLQSNTTVIAQGFARTLHDGSVATVLLNRGTVTAALSVSWSQLGLDWGSGCTADDLFTGIPLKSGVTPSGFTATTSPHSATAVQFRCL